LSQRNNSRKKTEENVTEDAPLMSLINYDDTISAKKEILHASNKILRIKNTS
jgi:hypothetical protein